MHRYRTHHTSSVSAVAPGTRVKLAGFVASKRDHRGVLFLDLRDASGTLQLVVEASSPAFTAAREVPVESAVSVMGRVVERAPASRNPKLETGAIELALDGLEVLGRAATLPFPIDGTGTPEELRLEYRYLDLRGARLKRNLELRAALLHSLRERMWRAGFLEVETPILTASSPEGARDFLVPSRVHPGKFYALPQAPQIFKQLLMVAGVDRYFQIAPCFRDEDARADRSPGEFYQLDMELAFVTQEDVFAAIEPILAGVFRELSGQTQDAPPFRRIPYAEALLGYGSDKPDLRNPLRAEDLTAFALAQHCGAVSEAAQTGEAVRGLRLPKAADELRRFFDGCAGACHDSGGRSAHLTLGTPEKGALAKLEPSTRRTLADRLQAEPGDALLLFSAPPERIAKVTHAVREHCGRALDLCEKDCFRFCWVVDYPMYERDASSGKIEFSHNPFSMPRGGLDALAGDPLAVIADQYDLVCNGVELSSGAIRNHDPVVMLRAFELAGYTRLEVERRFRGLFRAFHFGAPPHGGLAPGIDRMLMLLAGEPNIREVIAFPLTQRGEDLMMGAPSEVSPAQLRELHLRS